MSYEENLRQLQEYEHMRRMQQAVMVQWPSLVSSWSTSAVNTETVNPKEKLEQLKKSVKQIEAEPFTGEARKHIENKINRLQNAGATAQATVLEQELQTKDALVRLKEWDYKLLPKATIKQFESDNVMTLTRDGLRIHIDTLGSYLGNPQAGKEKDRIIPDEVLDNLETAKERELFDEFQVLWAEKVKDPILLGTINGCEDYFYICEWGDDITFEELTNGKS